MGSIVMHTCSCVMSSTLFLIFVLVCGCRVTVRAGRGNIASDGSREEKSAVTCPAGEL